MTKKGTTTNLDKDSENRFLEERNNNLTVKKWAEIEIVSNKSFPNWLNGRFGKSESKFISCNSFKAFFSNEKGWYARYTYWRCDEMIEAINF